MEHVVYTSVTGLYRCTNCPKEVGPQHSFVEFLHRHSSLQDFFPAPKEIIAIVNSTNSIAIFKERLDLFYF